MKNYYTYFIKKFQDPADKLALINLYDNYGKRISTKEMLEIMRNTGVADPTTITTLYLQQRKEGLAAKEERSIQRAADIAEATGVDAKYIGEGKGKIGEKKAAAIGVTSLIAGLLSTVDNALMGDANFGALSQAIDTAVHGASSALMKSGNPYAMCCCAGTKVYTNEGALKNIEDVRQEDGILGYLEKKCIQLPIEELFPPTYKECVQIETENGNILRCSIDHPIYSATAGRARYFTVGKKKLRRIKEFSFKRADLLKEGDYVAEIGLIPIFGNKRIKLAYLVGLLIGDGTYGRKKSPRLFTGDPRTWKYIEDNNLGKATKVYLPGGRYSKEFRVYTCYGLIPLLRELGIYGQTKQNKRLPKNIHEWDKESCTALIAGLFDTDGYVEGADKTHAGAYFAQSNLELIKELLALLLKFGIHGTVTKYPAKTKYIKNREISSKETFVLSIKTRESVINFYNNITLNIDYKLEGLQKAYFLKLDTKARDTSFEFHNVVADRIKRIIKLGYLPVYNLRAGISHTYIANNIVTHNTAGAALEIANFATKATGKTVQGYDVDINSSGYGNLGHMESKANRDFGAAIGLGGILGKGRIDRLLKSRNELALLAMKAGNISDTIKFEQEARMNSVDDVMTSNNLQLSGNLDTSLLAARRGAKLQKMKIALRSPKQPVKTVTDENGNKVKVPRHLTEDQKAGRTTFTYKNKEYYLAGDGKTCGSKEFVDKRNGITSAKNGAKLETIPISDEPSVIPEGSYHKNKHDIDLDHITQKGIPVITVDDDSVNTFEEIKEQEDSIIQHAEVERKEPILSKSLTDFVEEKREEWHKTKDTELCLEVGKRLTKEFLFNTIDNAGVINQIETKYDSNVILPS